VLADYTSGVADSRLAQAARALADDAVQAWYETGGGEKRGPPAAALKVAPSPLPFLPPTPLLLLAVERPGKTRCGILQGAIFTAAVGALLLPCPELVWLLCRWFAPPRHHGCRASALSHTLQRVALWPLTFEEQPPATFAVSSHF
jgi:hypothetical protein